MDYKQIHQDCYEDLIEELGREPNFEEMESAYRDRIASMVDRAKDLYKYEGVN